MSGDGDIAVAKGSREVKCAMGLRQARWRNTGNLYADASEDGLSLRNDLIRFRARTRSVRRNMGNLASRGGKVSGGRAKRRRVDVVVSSRGHTVTLSFHFVRHACRCCATEINRDTTRGGVTKR